jgi:phage baseplate assembly protein W
VPALPHLAVPIRFNGKTFATVDQDSLEEIEQCVLACVSTIVGSRIDAPGYGVPDETFQQLTPHPSVEAYLAAVQEAEPRAHLLGEASVEEMIKRVVLQTAAVNGG